jgi:thiol-disulfide isomerase/thioredoxin
VLQNLVPMRPLLSRAGLVLLVAAAATVAVAAVPRGASAQDASRPWLGVAMENDDAAAGVRVGHVIHGSPADKAGLHEGDRLVRVGGHAVARSTDVVRTVATFSTGDSLDLTFVRAGKEQTVRVTLAPFPSQDEMMRMDLVGTFAPTWKDVHVVSGTFPPAIADARGKVVLLDFWATWCAPCRVVIPKLGALQQRYGAQGLDVFGISTEDAQDVALFAQRMGMQYGVAADTHGQTTRSYGVASLPTLVVIDKRGVVRDVSIGYDPTEDAKLDATIRGLLAEPAP